MAEVKAERSQDLLQKRPRMSTKVDLPAVGTTEGAAGHASKKRKTVDLSDATSTLNVYPVEIQRYMQAEGFSEPTEIQERYAAVRGNAQTGAFLAPSSFV